MRSVAVRDALRINGRKELRLDRSWELRGSCVRGPGASNFNGRGGAAFNAHGGSCDWSCEKLRFAHAPLQILNRTKELRFGTNGRPWEFDKKNQILSAPHFNF